MKHMLAPRFLLAALCLILFSAGTASAQLFPGRITGAVRDTQGAAVPGATVKLTNPSTGLERTEVSDANGEFNFPQLALGNYTLTVTKEGFNTTVMKDITTSEAQVNTVTPVLTVGAVSSEIQVTAASPLLQTETNYTGGQLDQEQVESLPIGNSDYTRLALVLARRHAEQQLCFRAIHHQRLALAFEWIQYRRRVGHRSLHLPAFDQ